MKSQSNKSSKTDSITKPSTVPKSNRSDLGLSFINQASSSHKNHTTLKKHSIVNSMQFWLVIISIIINPLALDMFYWSGEHITQWISNVYQISLQQGYEYNNILSSAYIFGIFISQIFWSIVFSRGQRKIPFIIGMSIIAIAGILGTIFNNIVLQILIRMLIGMGVACELTAVTVLISDWYIHDIKQLNYSYSIITLVSLLGSLFTPYLAMLLINLFGTWKVIYIVLLVFSIIFSVLIYQNIDYQTSVVVKDIGSYTISYNAALSLVMNFKMLQQIMINSLSFGNIIIFYTSATFIFIRIYDISEQSFSLIMTINILGIILGNIINTYCQSKYDLKRMLSRAIHISLFVISCAIFLYHYDLLTLINIEILIFLLVICNGIIITNTTTGFILASNQNTSISTGINNIIRFGFALLVSIILIPIITMYQLLGILYLTFVMIILQIITLYIPVRKTT